MSATSQVLQPSAESTVDTMGHEGILEDRGRDPEAFAGGRAERAAPEDAVRRVGELAAGVDEDLDISPVVDVVTGVPARSRTADPA